MSKGMRAKCYDKDTCVEEVILAPKILTEI
jgi:hypothetical protein